ncbi:MAG: hypothetical protein K0T01_294 [Acidimicrobiia bacterium]|jgi:hypothetical protein|nr:hypothetical protein [Acidimicrobiia bacterium]
MPNYVVLYNAPVSAAAQMEDNDPDMAAAAMQAWNDWSARVGSGIVDLGTPLGNGRRVAEGGATEANSEVAGYSILKAADVDSAVALLQSHPHLQMPGASIEVHEALEVPGM